MEDILLLADASDSGKKLSYYLERNDVSVNVTGGPFENSAMLEAAARLMPVAVKNLVYEGADMCATNIDGDTPLIISSRLGCVEVVNILLENGCISATILNKKNFYGRSALFEACTMGHLAVVKILVDSLADPVASDNHQNTCLMQACRIGSKEIVMILLQLGTNPSLANEAGETALFLTCLQGNIEIAKILIEYKASASVKDKNGNSPLILAAKGGHRDIVSALLKKGANYSEANKFGDTALLAACEHGDVETVRTILSKTKNFRSSDFEGNSPLQRAVKSGSIELVVYLISHKESVSYKNNVGNTALHLAALVGDVNIILSLINNGASVSTRNNDGATPLLCAAHNGHLNALKALVASRGNIGSRNTAGNTPFLEAAFSGHLDVINFLSVNNADILARNQLGMNAVHVAACNDQDRAVELLYELGVEISALTEEGDTPLLLSCRLGFLKVTMKLLALGADPHIHDQDGNSALLIAAARGHSDLVELFFKLNIANISDENKHGNNALIEAAMNGQIGTALVILKHGADFGAVNKAGLSSYQYCASVPGLLSQWWIQCAEPIVVTGATGPCADEVNGLYDPVSINASESTCLNLGESSVNFGDDKISQYQYVKRLQYIGNKNYGGHFAMTKMKMTSSGIIIKRSSHQEKKSKIFARLNYKGGLPESNVLKRWEVSRDKGFLWTKFDKQERVKVWSKSQIVSLVTDDSVSNSILIDKISSMNIRLGDLVLLLDLPIELRNWSNEEILYYMQNGVDIFRMKIILVGPANSGKTALVKKLAASNPNSKLSKYENIITADCVMSDILFSIWDLGDVKTYSNMHSLFFDPKALYLFVWNPLVGDVADIEIHINSIRNCAPEAAIVVVCTHSDERSMPLDGSTLQELDDKFGNIWGCAHVGLRTNDGLVHLMEDLVRIASEQPSVHQKIPEKFVLLQDALGCEISERNKFSIQKEEFFVLATSVVGLNKASSERALELLKYWGNLFALSEEVLILQPPRLAEVFARLFTPAARTCVDRDPLMAGILYHSENVLESIWTGFDAKLYEHFLNLLYTNDMAYLVRGKDGKPFYGHGVSIIPELLTNGATESYEHFIRSSIFPEDTPFLSTLSIKFNTVSSSYFSKLHCRCGFAVLLGSSWKYGFAIEVKGCRSKASDLERFLSEHKSSYALVCMRPRHQTVDIYSFGDGFSACSLVLHAMIALRESSFPFMELKEAAVVDCNKIRVGLNQYFDSNNEKDYNFAAADKIIAFELNMLRGHKIERSDEHDSVWDRTLSTNTSLVDDIKNLGFGKRGRNDSEASVMSSIMAPRQDNGRREDKEVDENAGSNALTLCGDELFVSNDMKNLFDFIDLISNSPDEISVNLINLDIRLSFCVKELMSYTCTRGNHLKYAETCAMWVAYRTDDSGEIGNNNDYVTLCPISPSHRAGHFWDLMRHLRVTIPKAQLQEADGGALKGLSDYIRKALRHLLDDESRFILRDDIWIGFGDFSIILTQLARHEEKMFENLSRPPYRKPIFMSISSAEKLRFLPHVASERLLDVVMNSHGFYELNLPYNGSLIEKDPLYKLLYDFVNNEEVGEFKKAPLEGRERPILKSTSDEFSSFDAAQDLSLTASKSLMARLIGYGKIRIGYNYGMQHREFPTTIGFVDSSLLKQSLLSLSSTKSYARLAALRRMKDIFGVLKEPSNLIKSRYATLLASSMHGYLLCECCLQPQTGLGVKIVDAQPDGLTRQNSASGQRGLLRQGSVFSRQTSLQFNRQNSGLTRLGSHLSRQGSASLGRQNSHLGTADISLWPVKIRSPCDQIIPFLPLAMISLNAALAVNGPPNLGRLFGLPSHIIPDDMLPFVMDFIAAFDAPETSKDFQILQDKVRMVSSKDSPPLNFCIEQFGLFLMREDPQSTWKSFLSRRVAENGDVTFVCNQCVAAFNN